MGGMSPMEIFRNFHEKAGGTDSLEHATDAATALARRLSDRAGQIHRASSKMQGSWKGSASEAAAGEVVASRQRAYQTAVLRCVTVSHRSRAWSRSMAPR